MHFWLSKGVDGFRVGAVKHILEASHLRNEPQVDPNKTPVGYLFFNCIYFLHFVPHNTEPHWVLLFFPCSSDSARQKISASSVLATVCPWRSLLRWWGQFESVVEIICQVAEGKCETPNTFKLMYDDKLMTDIWGIGGGGCCWRILLSFLWAHMVKVWLSQ